MKSREEVLIEYLRVNKQLFSNPIYDKDRIEVDKLCSYLSALEFVLEID